MLVPRISTPATRRYPFRIVFRDEPDRLIVIAIAHAKRRPSNQRGTGYFDLDQ